MVSFSDLEVFSDNYLNDASFETKSNLCTKDLLHWSYQIANGMFYLSERKVNIILYIYYMLFIDLLLYSLVLIDQKRNW